MKHEIHSDVDYDANFIQNIKIKTLDLTFQESGDNTVDVEFVCLPHLAPLPEHFVLHAPALLVRH